MQREVRRVQRLPREDYDDSVSSTWLHLVDRIAHLRRSDAVASWLRTTAYHEALRIARTRARRAVAEVVLTVEVPEEQPGLTLGVMRAQVRRAMATTMDDLSPTGQRLLAALLDDPDQSYRELAERHGIGVGSIGPIRARVFQRARLRLGSSASRHPWLSPGLPEPAGTKRDQSHGWEVSRYDTQGSSPRPRTGANVRSTRPSRTRATRDQEQPNEHHR